MIHFSFTFLAASRPVKSHAMCSRSNRTVSRILYVDAFEILSHNLRFRCVRIPPVTMYVSICAHIFGEDEFVGTNKCFK